jgi:hypothetical protein
MPEKPKKEFKKLYIFVHPVFCFFAEPSRERIDRKAMKEFKRDLGKKIQEIVRDKEAMIAWIYPFEAMNAFFLHWAKKKKVIAGGRYDEAIKPYARLRDFAKKKMEGRYVDIGESLLNRDTNLILRMKQEGVKLAPRVKIYTFGEWRERCVNTAFNDVLKLFPGRIITIEMIEDLSLKGGEKFKTDYTKSYRRRMKEKMQARRKQAREKRRKAKKARKRGK